MNAPSAQSRNRSGRLFFVTRQAHDTPRTSKPLRQAGPAQCRCWTSPYHAECAAHGSEAQGGKPAYLHDPRKPLLTGLATFSSADPCMLCKQHEDLQTPAALQNVASIRRISRRRRRQAPLRSSAPEDLLPPPKLLLLHALSPLTLRNRRSIPTYRDTGQVPLQRPLRLREIPATFQSQAQLQELQSGFEEYREFEGDNCNRQKSSLIWG